MSNDATETAAPNALAPERVSELARSGEATLIDVREDYEWEAGRIAGAKHFSVNELTARAGDVPREGPVVFYCRGGGRSAMAAAAFREAGFDAHNMEGGLTAWVERDMPLEPDDGEVAPPRPPQA